MIEIYDTEKYNLREVALKTRSHYSNLGFEDDECLGFVAENLFRVYKGLDPVYSNQSDEGFDVLIDGKRIDVKACTDQESCFDFTNSYFTIDRPENLKADYYCYMKIDPFSFKAVIVGWNTLDEVKEPIRTLSFKKGDYIPMYYRRTRCDCLLIHQKFTHIV